MAKVLFVLAGLSLYVGAFALMWRLYEAMPDGGYVIILVAPAIPMFWLGSVCLKRGGAPPEILFRLK